MSYRKKAFLGVGYLTLLNILTQLVSFLKLSILARILMPSDFGLFALVTVTITTFETLSETGFNYAAIHMNVDIKKIAKILLVINITRGMLLSVLTLISAPLLSQFFKSENLLDLLLLASLIPFLRGFINPLTIRFQKELEFSKVFLTQFIPIVMTVISSIILVFYYHSAMALLLGLIIGTISEVIFSYMIVRFPTREPLNKKYLKKLFSYGKWITAGGLINYLSIQIDNLFIGKFFGTEALGLYDFAFKTANLAFTQVTDTISRVAFPLYVKRNKEKKHLQSLFIKNVVSVTIPALILTIPFLLFPQQILLFLFGEKWLVAAPTLQILSIYGLLRASIGPGGPLFLSVGKPEILTKLSTLTFILLIGLLFPLSKIAGVQGVAMAMTVSYALIFPLYIYQIYKYFNK